MLAADESRIGTTARHLGSCSQNSQVLGRSPPILQPEEQPNTVIKRRARIYANSIRERSLRKVDNAEITTPLNTAMTAYPEGS